MPLGVGMSRQRLELTRNHDVWAGFFGQEAKRVADALALLSPRIEHIGSTAVPGLLAKPIIDLAVVVARESHLAQSIGLLEGLGYRHRGQHGDDELRRYFVLEQDGLRMAQLHLWANSSPGWREAILFRDLLREREDLRDAYGREKVRVAKDVGWDKKAYAMA